MSNPKPTDKPLYLLPFDVLWDMDTPEAEAAVHTRSHAFHEAGHLWAAHHAGLPLRPTGLGLPPAPPYTADSEPGTAFIATLGPLCQGVAIAVDLARELCDDTSDWRHHLDPVLIVDATRECLEETCCCRYGGDAEAAADDLASDEYLESMATLMTIFWEAIETTAVRLMTDDVLDPELTTPILNSPPGNPAPMTMRSRDTTRPRRKDRP